MKIKLISFDDGIVSIGFRRISSLIKTEYPLTNTYIYNVGGVSAPVRNLFYQKRQDEFQAESEVFINPRFIKEIADADVIGFSGISKFARHIKRTISLVRPLNNGVLIIWGGTHATVFPEDAIQYADAVCIGEGEKSFLSLLKRNEAKEDIGGCPGFWIKKNGAIKKNALLPLMDNNELSLMPFQDYGFDIQHVTDRTLEPMSKDIYISQLGSQYNTVWALGCPFKCSYCSNSKFIKNHGDYAKVRHSAAEHLINELLEVIKNHDYVDYMLLQDDSLLMLDLDELREFAHLYKDKIGLSLFIPGLHPSTVNRDKLDILINAGLKKVRMGIQSGSKKTLSFYRRDNNTEKILHAATILSSFTPKIIPPFYDIIIDNPIETAQDKLQTLMLLRELKRPYLLYVYSLRVIPGTELYEFAQDHRQFHFQSIEDTYQSIRDKEMGLMIYLLALYRPPVFIFSIFLKISKIPYVKNLFFLIFQILFLIKVFYYETIINNYQPVAMFSPGLARFLYKIRKSAKCIKSQFDPRIADTALRILQKRK